MELTTEKYLHRWRAYLNRSDTVTVQCQPLGDIIQRAGFKHVDFLSLDVQGAEEITLRTVDPCTFTVIMSEAEPSSGARNEQVRKMLTELGFVRRPFSSGTAPGLGSNDLFFHPSVVDTRPGWAEDPAANMTAVTQQRRVEDKRIMDMLLAGSDWSTNYSRPIGRSSVARAARAHYLNMLSRCDAEDIASFAAPTRADTEAWQSRRDVWLQHTKSQNKDKSR